MTSYPLMLLFALPAEAGKTLRLVEKRRCVRKEGFPLVEGELGGTPMVVCFSGLGPVSARRRVAAYLADYVPRIVVATGFAGGLDPDLGVAEVVLDSNYSSERALAHLRSDDRAELPRREGRLLSVTEVVSSSEEKHEKFRSTGALAVDMETETVAGLCRERGIPLVALRAISDTAGDAMPVPLEVVFDMEAQRARPGRLGLFLLTHPRRSFRFCRFVWQLSRASAALAAVLPVLVSCLADFPGIPCGREAPASRQSPRSSKRPGCPPSP